MKPHLFRVFLDRYVPKYNEAIKKIGIAYTGKPERTWLTVEHSIKDIREHIEPMFDQIDALTGDVDIPDEMMGCATHDVSLALRALEEVRLARLN